MRRCSSRDAVGFCICNSKLIVLLVYVSGVVCVVIHEQVRRTCLGWVWGSGWQRGYSSLRDELPSPVTKTLDDIQQVTSFSRTYTVNTKTMCTTIYLLTVRLRFHVLMCTGSNGCHLAATDMCWCARKGSSERRGFSKLKYFGRLRRRGMESQETEKESFSLHFVI